MSDQSCLDFGLGPEPGRPKRPERAFSCIDSGGKGATIDAIRRSILRQYGLQYSPVPTGRLHLSLSMYGDFKRIPGRIRFAVSRPRRASHLPGTARRRCRSLGSTSTRRLSRPVHPAVRRDFSNDVQRRYCRGAAKGRRGSCFSYFRNVNRFEPSDHRDPCPRHYIKRTVTRRSARRCPGTRRRRVQQCNP